MMADPLSQLDNLSPSARRSDDLLDLLQRRYQAADLLRRGVCLLNAGQYATAETAFSDASRLGCMEQSLPTLIAACLMGQGKPGDAAERFHALLDHDETSPSTEIRYALAEWTAGRPDRAMQSLRDGILRDPECAELHFQLGALLASMEEYEEAELRFTQALSIQRDHHEALVNLGLCCGIRSAPAEAVAHLRRAQGHNPNDARIGVLLAQAARAAEQQGQTVRIRADMPDIGRETNDQCIGDLSRLIAAEPDFVDAFLAIRPDQVDERIFNMLLKTLTLALRRQPKHAALHYQRSRVLAHLGRNAEAISQNERAVEIDPRFTRALIELGRLYQKTDRSADAVVRLEQAVAAGADYADVHCLLGNLYRNEGHVTRARSAYKRALCLNNGYEVAMRALEALPVA